MNFLFCTSAYVINPLDGALVFVDFRYFCTDILIIWPNHLVLRVVLEWAFLCLINFLKFYYKISLFFNEYFHLVVLCIVNGFLVPKALCTLEDLIVFKRISAFKPFGPLLFLLNAPSLHLRVQDLCMYKLLHVWVLWLCCSPTSIDYAGNSLAWIGKQYLDFWIFFF